MANPTGLNEGGRPAVGITGAGEVLEEGCRLKPAKIPAEGRGVRSRASSSDADGLTGCCDVAKKGR